ncbi:hypothetical protein A1O1_08278 [Capronia coronata CBS 617.96]|uniref:Involucrin repeat protein n=1 Tax=Capronia coronata CBS 617.96 TaxID=1182541 RepID=W9XT07_9EURO|nr:uncharacterized protein A1O1_08278 [Capronia coronata CBS 617.96]EXJ80136.1 hypothetical protein A1O1_08278 [Capronia coronata CBS 617.96]
MGKSSSDRRRAGSEASSKSERRRTNHRDSSDGRALTEAIPSPRHRDSLVDAAEAVPPSSDAVRSVGSRKARSEQGSFVTSLTAEPTEISEDYHTGPRRDGKKQGREFGEARKRFRTSNRESTSEGRRRSLSDEEPANTFRRNSGRSHRDSHRHCRTGDSDIVGDVRANIASLPENQFPGEFPVTYTKPYRPPGLATEYYGDQGESVASQPGVRPNPPSIVTNAEQAHLIEPTIDPRPPPEPSSLGVLGAAASYFETGAAESVTDPPSISSRPSQTPTSRPDKPSSYSGQGPSPRTSPKPEGNGSRLQGNGLNTTGSGAPATMSAAGAALAYYSASNMETMEGPAQHTPTRPPTISGTGTASFSAPSGFMGSSSQEHSSAALYGAAAGTYMGTHFHSADWHNQQTSAVRPPGTLGGLPISSAAPMQQIHRHRRRGPLGKLVDWFRDPEAVAEFEQYTEAIGVCKYCFDPWTSPADAPRKHHYRRGRPSSGGRYGSLTRVDKTARYSSDEERRNRSGPKKVVVGGLAGYGAAKLGEAILKTNHDFDDTYSIKSGKPVPESQHGFQHRDRATDRKVRQYSSSEDVRSQKHESRRKKDMRHARVGQQSSRRRDSSSSASSSSSRRAAMKTGIGAAALAVGAAALDKKLRDQRKNKTRSSSPQKKYFSKRVSPMHSYVDLSASTNEGGAFTGFFASPSANKRAGKKPKGLFNFANSSSSSSDADLAYGEGTVRRKDSKGRRERNRTEHDRRNSTKSLMQLVAEGNALAEESDRRTGKGREIHEIDDSIGRRSTRTNHYASKHHDEGQTAAQEDGWYDLEDDDNSSSSSSVDMTLAYGEAPSVGTRQSPGPKSRHYQGGSASEIMPAIAVAAGAAAIGDPAQPTQVIPRRRKPRSLPHMQDLEPRPISDPISQMSSDESKRRIISPNDGSPQYTRIAAPAVPLQQPQPITPLAPSIYHERFSFAGQDEGPFTSREHDDSRTRIRETEAPSSDKGSRSSTRPRRDSSPAKFPPRDAKHSVSAFADEQPPTGSSTGSKSNKDPRRAENRRKSADAAILVAAGVLAGESGLQMSNSNNTQSHVAGGGSSDPADERMAEIERELQRLYEEQRLMQEGDGKQTTKSKGVDFAVPLLVGKDEGRGPNQATTNIRRKSSLKKTKDTEPSPKAESQQERIARMAAQRVKSTPSPVYEDYGTFFVPKELQEHLKDNNNRSEHRDDIGANVVEIVPGATKSNRQHPFDPFTYRPFGLEIDDDPTLHPWPVPMLGLVEPTPPGSQTQSIQGDISPHITAIRDEEHVDIVEPLEKEHSTDFMSSSGRGNPDLDEGDSAKDETWDTKPQWSQENDDGEFRASGAAEPDGDESHRPKDQQYRPGISRVWTLDEKEAQKLESELPVVDDMPQVSRAWTIDESGAEEIEHEMSGGLGDNQAAEEVLPRVMEAMPQSPQSPSSQWTSSGSENVGQLPPRGSEQTKAIYESPFTETVGDLGVTVSDHGQTGSVTAPMQTTSDRADKVTHEKMKSRDPGADDGFVSAEESPVRSVSNVNNDEPFLVNRPEMPPPTVTGSPTGPDGVSGHSSPTESSSRPPVTGVFVSGEPQFNTPWTERDEHTPREETQEAQNDADTSMLPSPYIPLSVSPRRLSAIRTTDDPSSPIVTSSPTAVPLQFRRPPLSPTHTRVSMISPMTSPTSPLTTPRTRQGRPKSTEFRSSKEFRPLYLVERSNYAKTMATPETAEEYPSLPSSKTSSAHPSMEDLRAESHAQQQLEYFTPSRINHDMFRGRRHSYSHGYDSERRRESPDYLDSRSATPVPGELQRARDSEQKPKPKYEFHSPSELLRDPTLLRNGPAVEEEPGLESPLRSVVSTDAEQDYVSARSRSLSTTRSQSMSRGRKAVSRSESVSDSWTNALSSTITAAVGAVTGIAAHALGASAPGDNEGGSLETPTAEQGNDELDSSATGNDINKAIVPEVASGTQLNQPESVLSHNSVDVPPKAENAAHSQTDEEMELKGAAGVAYAGTELVASAETSIPDTVDVKEPGPNIDTQMTKPSKESPEGTPETSSDSQDPASLDDATNTNFEDPAPALVFKSKKSKKDKKKKRNVLMRDEEVADTPQGSLQPESTPAESINDHVYPTASVPSTPETDVLEAALPGQGFPPTEKQLTSRISIDESNLPSLKEPFLPDTSTTEPLPTVSVVSDPAPSDATPGPELGHEDSPKDVPTQSNSNQSDEPLSTTLHESQAASRTVVGGLRTSTLDGNGVLAQGHMPSSDLHPLEHAFEAAVHARGLRDGSSLETAYQAFKPDVVDDFDVSGIPLTTILEEGEPPIPAASLVQETIPERKMSKKERRKGKKLAKRLQIDDDYQEQASPYSDSAEKTDTPELNEASKRSSSSDQNRAAEFAEPPNPFGDDFKLSHAADAEVSTAIPSEAAKPMSPETQPTATLPTRAEEEMPATDEWPTDTAANKKAKKDKKKKKRQSISWDISEPVVGRDAMSATEEIVPQSTSAATSDTRSAPLSATGAIDQQMPNAQEVVDQSSGDHVTQSQEVPSPAAEAIEATAAADELAPNYEIGEDQRDALSTPEGFVATMAVNEKSREEEIKRAVRSDDTIGETIAIPGTDRLVGSLGQSTTAEAAALDGQDDRAKGVFVRSGDTEILEDEIASQSEHDQHDPTRVEVERQPELAQDVTTGDTGQEAPKIAVGPSSAPEDVFIPVGQSSAVGYSPDGSADTTVRAEEVAEVSKSHSGLGQEVAAEDDEFSLSKPTKKSKKDKKRRKMITFDEFEAHSTPERNGDARTQEIPAPPTTLDDSKTDETEATTSSTSAVTRGPSDEQEKHEVEDFSFIITSKKSKKDKKKKKRFLFDELEMNSEEAFVGPAEVPSTAQDEASGNVLPDLPPSATSPPAASSTSKLERPRIPNEDGESPEATSLMARDSPATSPAAQYLIPGPTGEIDVPIISGTEVASTLDDEGMHEGVSPARDQTPGSPSTMACPRSVTGENGSDPEPALAGSSTVEHSTDEPPTTAPGGAPSGTVTALAVDPPVAMPPTALSPAVDAPAAESTNYATIREEGDSALPEGFDRAPEEDWGFSTKKSKKDKKKKRQSKVDYEDTDFKVTEPHHGEFKSDAKPAFVKSTAFDATRDAGVNLAIDDESHNVAEEEWNAAPKSRKDKKKKRQSELQTISYEPVGQPESTEQATLEDTVPTKDEKDHMQGDDAPVLEWVDWPSEEIKGHNSEILDAEKDPGHLLAMGAAEEESQDIQIAASEPSENQKVEDAPPLHEVINFASEGHSNQEDNSIRELGAEQLDELEDKADTDFVDVPHDLTEGQNVVQDTNLWDQQRPSVHNHTVQNLAQEPQIWKRERDFPPEIEATESREDSGTATFPHISSPSAPATDKPFVGSRAEEDLPISGVVDANADDQTWGFTIKQSKKAKKKRRQATFDYSFDQSATGAQTEGESRELQPNGEPEQGTDIVANSEGERGLPAAMQETPLESVAEEEWAFSKRSKKERKKKKRQSAIDEVSPEPTVQLLPAELPLGRETSGHRQGEDTVHGDFSVGEAEADTPSEALAETTTPSGVVETWDKGEDSANYDPNEGGTNPAKSDQQDYGQSLPGLDDAHGQQQETAPTTLVPDLETRHIDEVTMSEGGTPAMIPVSLDSGDAVSIMFKADRPEESQSTPRNADPATLQQMPRNSEDKQPVTELESTQQPDSRLEQAPVAKIQDPQPPATDETVQQLKGKEAELPPAVENKAESVEEMIPPAKILEEDDRDKSEATVPKQADLQSNQSTQLEVWPEDEWSMQTKKSKKKSRKNKSLLALESGGYATPAADNSMFKPDSARAVEATEEEIATPANDGEGYFAPITKKKSKRDKKKILALTSAAIGAGWLDEASTDKGLPEEIKGAVVAPNLPAREDFHPSTEILERRASTPAQYEEDTGTNDTNTGKNVIPNAGNSEAIGAAAPTGTFGATDPPDITMSSEQAADNALENDATARKEVSNVLGSAEPDNHSTFEDQPTEYFAQQTGDIASEAVMADLQGIEDQEDNSETQHGPTPNESEVPKRITSKRDKKKKKARRIIEFNGSEIPSPAPVTSEPAEIQTDVLERSVPDDPRPTSVDQPRQEVDDLSDVSASTRERRKRRRSPPVWSGEEPEDLPNRRSHTPPYDHDIISTALEVAAGLGFGADEKEPAKAISQSEPSPTRQQTAEWTFANLGAVADLSHTDANRDSGVQFESPLLPMDQFQQIMDSGFIPTPADHHLPGAVSMEMERAVKEPLRPPRPMSPTSSTEDVSKTLPGRRSDDMTTFETPRRKPSPVESTSKDRSSALFAPSPAMSTTYTMMERSRSPQLPPTPLRRSPSIHGNHHSREELKQKTRTLHDSQSNDELASNLIDRAAKAEVNRSAFELAGEGEGPDGTPSPARKPLNTIREDTVEATLSANGPLPYPSLPTSSESQFQHGEDSRRERGLVAAAGAASLAAVAAPTASRDLAGANSLGRSKSRTSSLRNLRGVSISPYDPASVASNSPQALVDEGGLGKTATRERDMADIYDGYGSYPGSPKSPTRPPSVRRRQSMQQIKDLETKLEQLASENRALAEAKMAAEQHLELANFERNRSESSVEALRSTAAQLQERDAEIARLREEVAALMSTHEALKKEHEQSLFRLQQECDEAQSHWQETTQELETLRMRHMELSSGMESIVRHEIDTALADKNAEIQTLHQELETARDKIRELQSRILQNGADDVVVLRDEDYFDAACQKLCQQVQGWVLRFSKFNDLKRCRSTNEVRDEKIVDRFDNSILDGSDVDVYLADRVKRRDVFMSVVMTMIWEYVFTRYLFGMDREQRQKLKQLEKNLAEVGPASAVHQWRALTLTLLSKRESFQAQRESDTEAVALEIFNTLSRFLPPPQNLEEQLLASLRSVMHTAVELSIEMRTQRAEYIMLPPLQPEYDTNGDLARKVYFNASLMNERSGETTSNEELERNQAVVRMVLFPLVVKKGDDSGRGEDEIVVCPAQVLVARPDKSKKVRGSSRLASGGSQTDPMAVDGRSLRAVSTHSLGAMSGIDGTDNLI